MAPEAMDRPHARITRSGQARSWARKPGELQDATQFKRSCWSSQEPSRRQEDFILTACGFTAGGSGRVSSDDITSNAASTHTEHPIDFISTRAPILIIT